MTWNPAKNDILFLWISAKYPVGVRTFALAFKLLENADLLNKGHHLSLHRSILPTSNQLAKALLQRQTYFCGTVRQNQCGEYIIKETPFIMMTTMNIQHMIRYSHQKFIGIFDSLVKCCNA